MVDRLNKLQGTTGPKPYTGPIAAQKKASKTDFSAILNKAENRDNGVEFSNHAIERMKRRNIHFNDSDMKKISDAVDTASRKGSRESLFMINGVNLVVSVPNRKVVTAVPQQENGIFTNIDSAMTL